MPDIHLPVYKDSGYSHRMTGVLAPISKIMMCEVRLSLCGRPQIEQAMIAERIRDFVCQCRLAVVVSLNRVARPLHGRYKPASRGRTLTVAREVNRAPRH